MKACPVPEDPGHRNGAVLRPPLALAPVAQAPPPAPEPAPREPESAPPASFDIFDKVAVARQIRAWYSAHHTPRIIAVWLNRFGVPNERASHWYNVRCAGAADTRTGPRQARRVMGDTLAGGIRDPKVLN